MRGADSGEFSKRRGGVPHRRIDTAREVDGDAVTDPVTLTGPWTFKYMYKRAPGYKMNEYVCEANREFLDPETGGVKLKIGK